MDTNVFSKIRKHIVGILVISMLTVISITTIAVIGLISATNRNNETLEALSQSSRAKDNMQQAFSGMRIALRDLQSTTDQQRISEIRNQINSFSTTYQQSCDVYLGYSNSRGVRNGLEYDLFAKLRSMLSAYNNVTSEIIQAAMANDHDKVNGILEQTETPMSNDISSLFFHLQDISNVQINESMSIANQNSNKITILLFTGTIAAMLILIIIMVIAIKNTRNLQASAEEKPFVYQDTFKQPQIKETTEPNLLSEFAKQINDLKVVTYDLTKLLKERK